MQSVSDLICQLLKLEIEPSLLNSNSNIFRYTIFFLRVFYETICEIISSICNLIIHSREKRQVILSRNNVTTHYFIPPSLEKRQSQNQTYRVSYRATLVVSQCSFSLIFNTIYNNHFIRY